MTMHYLVFISSLLVIILIGMIISQAANISLFVRHERFIAMVVLKTKPFDCLRMAKSKVIQINL